MTTSTLPFPRDLVADSDELPWVSIAPGFAVKLLRATTDDDVWVELLRLEPGTVVPRHRHTGEVHTYTLAGQRELIPSGVIVGAGDYVYEPAGNIDAWRAIGDDPLVIFVTIRGAIEYLDGDTVTKRKTATTAVEAYRRGGGR